MAGLYNDLATLFLSNPDDTVKHIFSLGNLTPHAEVCQGDNCYFTLRSLAILSPAYLLLMAAGASLAIPGGLFMPSIMVCPSWWAESHLLTLKPQPHPGRPVPALHHGVLLMVDWPRSACGHAAAERVAGTESSFVCTASPLAFAAARGREQIMSYSWNVAYGMVLQERLGSCGTAEQPGPVCAACAVRGLASDCSRLGGSDQHDLMQLQSGAVTWLTTLATSRR